MPVLYLIRHPLTQIDPSRPPAAWDLSGEGERQVAALLRASFWQKVTAIYCSDQSKALRPAQAISREYGLPLEVRPELAEVKRETGYLADQTEFERMLERTFLEPVPPVAGWESRQAALVRFTKTIHEMQARYPSATLALISHGTILTLVLSALLKVPPTLERWRSIGFGTVATIDLDSMQLMRWFVPPDKWLE